MRSPTSSVALVGAILGFAAVAAAQSCPAQLERVATVPTGCPCNPSGQPYGQCEAGFVCSQPWALTTATAAASKRLLLAATSSPASTLNLEQGDATAAYSCGACALGMYCPRGSILPQADSPNLQL